MKNLVKYIVAGVVVTVATVCGVTIFMKFRKISNQKKEFKKNVAVLKAETSQSLRSLEKKLTESVESKESRKESIEVIKQSAKHIYDEYEKSGDMLGFKVFLQHPIALTKSYLFDSDFRNAVDFLNDFQKKYT